MLTDRLEYIPNALFIALNQFHENCVPVIAACSAKSPLEGGTRTNAHITIASHAIGTIMPLMKNKYLTLCGERSMKGSWINQ